MKILAVCGFGVGSSMVLKMTIDKAIRELNIDAEVENTDLSSAKSMDADVYLTSSELKEELSRNTTKPVYPIKKYMDKEEVKDALKQYLSERGNE
ncbi:MULTISPECIES: PTS sugar transporter subunit IIB [Terrabacteria group]|uniref:PTS sugar transporter subunit IIB n=1 Tax=Bacillati TaxID=1783272 RepID=UPI00193AC52C|nr:MULTISPECIES: PTS sugar transporter subunit IIB [Terrabacteria group]MBW9212910.1 PTS sugar transporter subunit IIB [Trueperella sp. zg.1013]QRG86971.1 PTS sugar transporter subunit IIB [Bulleidia sp. zg-1006]